MSHALESSGTALLRHLKPGRGTGIHESDDMADGRHLHDSVESDTESTVEDTMESLVERARGGESSRHALGNAISPQVVLSMIRATA